MTTYHVLSISNEFTCYLQVNEVMDNAVNTVTMDITPSQLCNASNESQVHLHDK
jgi:hypothetical protein